MGSANLIIYTRSSNVVLFSLYAHSSRPYPSKSHVKRRVGPVVGPTAIELHWRRVGRAFAEVTLSLASAGSYTLRWSVPGVATPPQTATGRWRRDGSALTLAPCVDELSAYEWLDDGKLVVTVDGEAHVSLPPRHVVKGP